ncbi:MAG: MATE family efflux transporter [Phycisphaerae bacterium]
MTAPPDDEICAPAGGADPCDSPGPNHPGAARRRVTLLDGDVRRTVIWLALPVLGEQLLNAGVAWNDQFLAGFFDKTATGAVGFAAYISWLMNMLFMLVGIGATAIVARSIGAGNEREARHATNQAIRLAIAMGLIGMVVVYAGARTLIQFCNISGPMADMIVTFLYIEATVLVIEAVTFVGAACLRGAGDTRTPMVVLGVVNLVNMAVSWLLAFAFDFGIAGIAWGTVMARVVGGAMMMYVLTVRHAELRVSPVGMRTDRTMIRRVLRIGLPAAVDGMLLWAGHFIFMRFVTRSGGGYDGDTLFAAHMIGIRIESLSYLPALAWATAAATLVGQNLGAGKPDRARRCANESMFQSMALLIFVGVLYFVFAPHFYAFLSGDARVIDCGVPALRALAIVQPTLALLIVYMHALRGAGDTLVPMLFTIVGMIFLRLPVAYVCGVVMQGALLGAWLGMFVDLLARSALVTWRFRSGRWMKIRV